MSILDYIWWTHNEIYHKDIQVSLAISVQKVKERFEELKHAFRSMDISEGRQFEAAVTEGWESPPKNFMKINTDVAVRGKYSILGLVAKNPKGEVAEIHAANFCDPMIAELAAVKNAIQLSWKNRWRNIICQSDSVSIIQCLNGKGAENIH